jgi:hypothetical protein
MVFQIEPKTRQFIGLMTLGGAVIAMIFTGLITPPEYQKYVGILLGGLFYHIVRMLNQSPEAGKMVPSVNPTQELPK